VDLTQQRARTSERMYPHVVVGNALSPSDRTGRLEPVMQEWHRRIW
jgi:hypothetical protein